MSAQPFIDRWKVLYEQQRAAEKELVLAIEQGDAERARALEAQVKALRAQTDEALKQVYSALEAQRRS